MADPDSVPTSPAPTHAGFDVEMRVDWLDAAELGDSARHGRLGMTFLPGKRGASSRYPGHTYRRDAADDLAALRAQGARSLVLLVEDHELTRWSDPQLVALGTRAGIRVHRFPIPDGGAPGVDEMASIIAAVQSARGMGDVVVACMGGVGRSGMVAACALVDAGVPPADAIARVRAIRHPTAVETAEQEALVAAYAERREGSPG